MRPLLVHAIPLVRGVEEALLLRKAMQYAAVKRELSAKLDEMAKWIPPTENATTERAMARAEMLLFALAC